MAVHLAVAGDVFNGVSFSHEMSWMKSGTLLSQFLRIFLPKVTVRLSEITTGCIYLEREREREREMKSIGRR